VGVEGPLEVDAGFAGQQPESEIEHRPALNFPGLQRLLAL